MQNSPQDLILITGATGAQGSATLENLLKKGHHARAITRNPEKPSILTKLLQQYPSQLQVVKGDYDDPASLEAALSDVSGVFSVQIVNLKDEEAEVRQAKTLIDLAKKAGVKRFVHTSVSRAGEQENFKKWGTGYWSESYWTSKADIEKAVHEAGFEYYTILKPAFMMDNFIPPKSLGMFPDLAKGEIVSVLKPETKLHLIAANDIGVVACAAFENPEKFNKKVLELAAEAPTIQEISEVLSENLKKKIVIKPLSVEEAVQRGQYLPLVRSYEWINEEGYNGNPEELKEYGINLISFAEWAKTWISSSS